MEKLDETRRRLIAKIAAAYEEIETNLIYQIALKFKTLTNIEDVSYLIDRLNSLNIMDEEVLKLISQISGKPLSMIKEGIKELGYESINLSEFTNGYEKGLISIDPLKINFNPVINKHIDYIDENIKYIQSQAQKGLYQDSFKAIKKAQLEVELGVKSPNEAIVNAVKELSSKGIKGDSFLRETKKGNGEYVEVEQNLETVVRRAVRTSFTNTASDMNEKLGDELETEHWYMSQHLGARTTGTGYHNHAKWQGKVYETEELVTVCGKGEDQGYLGYGCRHLARPFIKGVSVEPPPTLNMEELERVYELEQKQRKMERDIRNTKRKINALDILDIEEAKQEKDKSNKKLRMQQKKIRTLINENEDVLRRDYSREKVIKPPLDK